MIWRQIARIVILVLVLGIILDTCISYPFTMSSSSIKWGQRYFIEILGKLNTGMYVWNRN